MHYKTSYGSVAEAVKHEDGIAVLGIMLEVSYTENILLNPIIHGLAKIHKAGECERAMTVTTMKVMMVTAARDPLFVTHR